MIFISKTARARKMKEVDQLMNQLITPISFVFTPINLEEERKKFFESETYNPQFKYSLLPNKNKEILKELNSITHLTDVDPRVSELYIRTIETKNILNDLYDSAGDNKLVTKYSVERYGFPSGKLFNNACLVLKDKFESYNLSPIKFKGQLDRLDSKQIVNILEKALKEFDFNDWNVVFSKRNNGKTVRVGVKEREIVLGSNEITRSKFRMRKLIIHEVGSHIFRWNNGKNSGINLLSKLNTNESIEIEEGFASYNEYIMGVMGEKELKSKARLAYVTYLANDLSFRQLFNVLKAQMSKEKAFNYVLRVKKGMGDTSIPGVYTKGILYFKGFRKVRKAIAQDQSVYEKLFAGKISLKEVDWVSDGLIPKPEMIIDKKEFEGLFNKLGI